MPSILRPHVLKLAALAAISFFSQCFAERQTYVIGEVSRLDINKPVYEVHLPSIGEFPPEKHPEDEAVHGFTAKSVVTARGQRMRCLLPDPWPSKKPSPNVEKSDETVFDDIDDHLNQYENKCLHRHDGWWTYEFCYGKHVAQKHIDTEKNTANEGNDIKVVDEFMLGRFDREQDLLRRKNRSEVERHDAAFTQLYINGTVCDMTNKPRRTLIKYMCIDETPLHTGSTERSQKHKFSFLGPIREVETCVYELDFYSYAICLHPLYRQKMENLENPIRCTLEEGEGPFQGLSSTTYKKASLNL